MRPKVIKRPRYAGKKVQTSQLVYEPEKEDRRFEDTDRTGEAWVHCYD